VSRPLAIDIDGTMTRPDGGIDHRLFEPLREWDGPVVIATGKSFPYPVALCAFVGIEERLIAENGGVTLVDDELGIHGDASAARAVADQLEADGYPGGWPDPDMHNRWRETELSVTRDVPLDHLKEIAAAHNQVVVDTGYAYHVKSDTVDKATGLRGAADRLNRDPGEFVAIGDSANDAEIFDIVDAAYAVANADETALDRADVMTGRSYGDGTLEALAELR